jgi:hypothetical protein
VKITDLCAGKDLLTQDQRRIRYEIRRNSR